MNFNEIEMRRETIFKDAVLSAAEAKGMDIIGEAQRQAARQLEQARAACETADHDAIKSALAPDNEREHSTALYQARQALLQHRAELVEALFADVEKRVAVFVQGKGYRPWLLGKLKEVMESIKNAENVVIYVRKEDEKFAADLKASAGAAAEVAPDAGICLGGVRVRCGQVLYDLTLDSALSEEKERFSENSGLTL